MVKIAVVIDPHSVEKNHRCRTDKFLDTVIEKLDYVASENDYVLTTGDLVSYPCNSTLLFITLYNLFKKHEGKFHGILGNHDIINRNTGEYMFKKTTVGALATTGVYNIHREEFTLGGVTFVPAEVDADVKTIPVDKDNSKVLIAHKFYEQKFSPTESFFRDDIVRLNYNTVILGHDHKPYEDEYIGNSMLLRHGSLTRIDIQRYNKDRDICYYRIISEGNGFDVERVVIPYRPIKEVYTEEAYRAITSEVHVKEQVSFMEIGEAISRLTKPASGVNSLDRILRELDTPKKCIDDIKWKHELNNVQYT